jgi:hypothetical protein
MVLSFQEADIIIQNIDIESQNRLLKVCYVPATSASLPRRLLLLLLFLAAAINSTNEANKAGSTRHQAVYIT